MKFIWEESDVDETATKQWGLMASRGEEIVIIGGKRLTSLRDGHSWEYDSYEEMVKSLNKGSYIPILAPMNPSVIIKRLHKKQFNYGDCEG